MTTNLTFNSGTTTETLRGGTDYNISEQGANFPEPPTNVTLNLVLPSTIDNDTIRGGSISGHAFAQQTLNFHTMKLKGELSIYHNASATLNGHTLINNSTISVGDATGSTDITINTQMLGGTGMEFISGAEMTVNGRVGGGQTFDIGDPSKGYPSGSLFIDSPNQFSGNIDLQPAALNCLVDLVGLAATSYDYSDNVLTLWNGNKAVDHLNLAGHGFGVYQYQSPGGFPPSGVLLISTGSTTYGTVLPLHSTGA